MMDPVEYDLRRYESRTISFERACEAEEERILKNFDDLRQIIKELRMDNKKVNEANLRSIASLIAEARVKARMGE